MLYGIDIGGSKIETVIFDHALKRKDSWRVVTPRESYEFFLETLIASIDKADHRWGEEGTVGIGLPGIIKSDGICLSSNIPCINGKALKQDLRQALLPRHVEIENDKKVFALSEATGGSGDGAEVMLGVILGTGMGGGLVVDGKLFKDKNGIAGEWGHAPISAALQRRYGLPLRQCGCGSFGCLETYVSGPGLIWCSHHLGGDYSNSVELLTAVRNNEPCAQRAFSMFIDCLAAGLAQAVLYYEPDVIVLGGGLSNIVEIYQQLPDKLSDYFFPNLTMPPVLPPRFGDASGARGAALLAQYAG